MRIVVFNGSPRVNGNTELLLNEVMKGAKELGGEITRFDLNRMKIKGCQECGYCEEKGLCKIKDDMQKIYPSFTEGERFIVASPIYFMNVSAQLKLMIDRTQSIWCQKYRLKKPIPSGPRGRKGLFICVGGMKREDEISCSNLTVKAFFRSINVQEHRELSYLGVDEKGAILKRPEALMECYQAGRELMS